MTSVADPSPDAEAPRDWKHRLAAAFKQRKGGISGMLGGTR